LGETEMKQSQPKCIRVTVNDRTYYSTQKQGGM